MAARRQYPKDEAGKFVQRYKKGVMNTLTYRSWVSMRQRCTDKNSRNYKNYGGRGITFCPAWNDYLTFLADMGERQPGMSLDRIDVNGPYAPGNCRWADKYTQQRNRGNNRPITAFGETKLLIEWTEDSRCVVAFSVLRNRLFKSGWDAERAISEVPAKRRPNGSSPRYLQKVEYRLRIKQTASASA